MTDLEEKKNQEGFEGDEEPSTPKERILNQPSDEHDILPRPPQFAHLKLMPKWYDSTVRIAQNKLNKSKRRHRKTHGLVGFLELTNLISKAWAEADAETKGYCKRVADRQLGYYKDKMEVIKKQQEQHQQQLLMGQHQQATHKMPPPMRSLNDSHGFHDRRMPMSHPSPPRYWQHPQEMSPREIKAGAYPEQFPLTPPSHETYIEDQRYYDESPRNSRPGGKMHPLEELMLRRRIYGSRSNDAVPRIGHAAWPNHPMQTTVVGSGGESLHHAQTYASPAETTGTSAKKAVTPSPPRKEDPSTPTFPMKKRLKKEEPADSSQEFSPVSLDSGGILESGGAFNSSPLSASFPSPSEMSNMFSGSPLSNSSYQRVLGPYLFDSPMPYMDFTPQESIASPTRRPATVPSHLTLPGSYAATSTRAPHQRGGRSPFTEELGDGILDFDEEEMDYMWNKLAKSTLARRQAKAAAAQELFRMNHYSSVIASPGNMNALGLAHSFASPAAPSDIKVLSPGVPVAAKVPPLPSVDEEKQGTVKE